MVPAELGGDLVFLPFLREEEFEGGAVQGPKHRGAWPPEDLFRAQNNNQDHGSHSAYLCGNSPASFVSNSLRFMNFYTVCIYQP